MADSTPKALEELEYLRLGDLAIQGFRRLSEKYREPTGQGRNANVSESETLPIAETITSKEKRLEDLQFHLLPALHLQFADLWNSLGPSCLQVVDMLKLKRLLEIQDHIEQTIDEIRSHVDIICPESTTYTTPNDQDLKQFKSFRLCILRAQFPEAFPFIIILFCDAYRLLESLIIDSEASENSPHFSKDFLIEQISYCIDWTIVCIKGSESDIAQCFWRHYLTRFDNMLIDVNILVDPHITYHKMEDEKEPVQKLVSEPVIQLANVVTTLIKLCKLFFTKLSTRWMNRKRFPYCTEMSSEQIQSLAQSIRNVTRDLVELVALFQTADQEMIDDRAELSQGFLDIGTSEATSD
ncbi:hypothetical protein Pst134EA_020972 [Puccinia striiformis f. sp. tritici]|uniref:hypothetical protein n=1 Tax=Puccinia striiformis f. sp. tritici TaxID=168172 RepID=UPI002008C96E|nr:hypothetical protein Pst134EA_020972 [Puccinia striiformis f. sp. tritici]KAH9457074.1 hypothetical protein Pst134EA_020972 [Puccinia striiformis f. sp. tritici]KAI9621684.1 hypothetical protein KEM48_007613 [Puccinia striiformis f. sp. tritici PST-130]